MNAEKLKKIITATVSSAMLLLCILLSALVYQIVLIGRTKAKINELQDEITRLEQENTQTQSDIDKWLNKWKIEERARELGWLYEDDK